MLDITVWIEKLQKFKLSNYYSELRVYITAYSGRQEQTIQNTQRHKMPKMLGVLIGGSNTLRLTRAFEEMGKPVESLVASRWTITMGSVDSLLPNLADTLEMCDPDLRGFLVP